MSKLIVVLLASTVTLSGCSLIHRSQQARVERKQEKANKAIMQEYDKARKQHLENQSKSTARMMKKTGKKSDRLNAPKLRKGNSKKKCGF